MAEDQSYSQQSQQYDQQSTQQSEMSSVEQLPEVLYLMQFCAQAFSPQGDTEEARVDANASWDPVREWLSSHSPAEVREAAEQRDDVGKTALHFACQNAPPLDIIKAFLNVANNTVEWPDSFGWLPIHYACAYGAETEVIRRLADQFPASKTTVDRKGRTPLHFFLGSNSAGKNTSDVVIILSNTGAASYPTDEGLLPLHLACAYGRPEETLLVLMDAYPEAIKTLDTKSRTPLHFVLSNAGRANAPAAVRLLLNKNPELVDSVGGGALPLLVLAQYAASIDQTNEEQTEAVQGCLRNILTSRPKPTPEFFTALQRLPDFLQERAVVMRVVQELLNVKIAQRFPTLILLLDFGVTILVLVAYTAAVIDSIKRRRNGYDSPLDSGWPNDDNWYWIGLLYLGALYHFTREMIELVSLAALGTLRFYFRDLSNWINLVHITLITLIATLCLTKGGNHDVFQTGASLTVLALIIKFMTYLRNVYIDFAIFVGGVTNVIRRLGAFLFCLAILLVAFSRMFYTIFVGTEYCENPLPLYRGNYDNDTIAEFLVDLEIDDITGTGAFKKCYDDQTSTCVDGVLEKQIICNEYITSPWCHHWASFLTVYTMFLGEVDEYAFIHGDNDKFRDISMFQVILFAIFMFLMVILLANVLIAIVTDSYKVIQDQRAAIVFWTNRLDFIAEMDAVANGPWKKKLRRLFGLSNKQEQYESSFENLGKGLWQRCMDILYEDEVDDSLLSFEFYCYALLRLLLLLVVIPAWFLIGLATAGMLWPPQVRAYLFASSITKATEADKEDELRKNAISNLESEMDNLKEELLQELAVDRTQVVQMKSLVVERRLEIQNEMKHIKRVVTMLFEQQSGM